MVRVLGGQQEYEEEMLPRSMEMPLLRRIGQL